MPFALAKGWKRESVAEVLVYWQGIAWRGAVQKRMSKDFSRKFYSSQAWNNCRAAYMNQVNHLCERCLRNGLVVPAEIVHHKIELTPSNILNPDITLNFNNLEAVCRDCHSDIHKRREKRFKIMDDGRVIAVEK